MNDGMAMILGGGLISPAASSGADALERLLSGDPPAPIPSRTVPEAELVAASGLPPRELRKLDRFSLLAVSAARRALEEAALGEERRDACGVLTGNMLAGWTFTEPQLHHLHESGPGEVSPYLATAWFPAAPQGQISIHLGLKGFAKTITTDRCSAAQAIGIAFERIERDPADVVLAGGVEAPLTDWVEEAVVQSPAVDGWLGEGAAYVVLARQPASAVAVAGYTSCPFRRGGPTAALLDLVRRSDVRGRDLPPLAGVVADLPPDRPFCDAVAAAFREDPSLDVPLLFTSWLFGETLGAGTALALEVARAWLHKLARPASVGVLSTGSCSAELLSLTSVDR